MSRFDALSAYLTTRRSRFRTQLEHLPAPLRADWRRSAPLEFPGIPLSETFFVRAADGLMRFFELAASRSAACALPSVAADSVWHAWLHWDADHLDHFCRRHFDKPVAHLPQCELGAGALTHALAGARRIDGIAPEGPHLPALFTLDARLRMPFGHGYWNQAGEVVYGRLDGDGRRSGYPARHPDLTLQALFAASLITHSVYLDAMLRQDRRSSGSNTSDGAGADGGCSDSADGGAGGDSGGSSCGGGCGGGGGD